jgi:hypothetical protein
MTWFDEEDLNSLNFKTKEYIIMFYSSVFLLMILAFFTFRDSPREGKLEGYDIIKKMVTNKKLSEKEYDRLFHNNKKYMEIKKDFFKN